jgi:GGDEF domain-containing protein
LIINNCNSSEAEIISNDLFEIISEMEPVPAQDDNPEFYFTTTISWAVWAKDNAEWDSFFQGNYASLLDAWRAGGNRIVHYSSTESK